MAGLEAEQKASELLAKEEQRFSELWRALVWEKWTPSPHTRNQWIVERVPFLCRVGGRTFVLKCSILLHQAAGIFADSLAAHTQQTQAMIASVTATTTQQLSPVERAVYSKLDERHREAFLVLRDCAQRKPDGVFPMSCKELRVRPCLPENKAADRILKRFARLHLIALVELGEQYRLGHKPKATTWRWLLSGPPQFANATHPARTVSTLEAPSKTPHE